MNNAEDMCLIEDVSDDHWDMEKKGSWITWISFRTTNDTKEGPSYDW